tara:strand:- start:1890 stop:2003 length:114 start_codon:yes stop_codon:yes gene_type:complete
MTKLLSKLMLLLFLATSAGFVAADHCDGVDHKKESKK